MLSNKIQQITYSKLQAQIEEKQLIAKLKLRQAELTFLIANKRNTLEERKQTLEQEKQNKLAALKTRIERGDTAAIAEQQQIELEYEGKKKALDLEITALEQESIANSMQLNLLGETQSATLGNIAGTVSVVGGGILSLVTGSQA